jgi:hypothetical protein
MVQLADIFSKPEMSLIASVMDFFLENDIEYQPESLYFDVSKCIGLAHATFHSETRSHPHLYLHKAVLWFRPVFWSDRCGIVRNNRSHRSGYGSCYDFFYVIKCII